VRAVHGLSCCIISRHTVQLHRTLPRCCNMLLYCALSAQGLTQLASTDVCTYCFTRHAQQNYTVLRAHCLSIRHGTNGLNLNHILALTMHSIAQSLLGQAATDLLVGYVLQGTCC